MITIHLPIGTHLYSKCKSLKASTTSWSPPEETRDFSNFFKDISEYYLSPNYRSNGSIINKSLHTYYSLVNEINLPKNSQSCFIKDIPSSYYPVLQIAGLFHDTGNLRNLKSEYIWIDNSEILLSEYLLNNCKLTPEEWKLVEIINNDDSNYDSFDPVIVYQLIRAVKKISNYNGNDICIGPIKSFTLIPNDESFVTTKQINLIVFTYDNIKNFLTNTQELDSEIYELITNKTELRKYFLYELVIEIEMNHTFESEARNEIYHWYFSAERNKLSTKCIDDLIKRLKKYPRDNWDDNRIDMTIRRLSSPTYNLEDFILEYDNGERIKRFGNQVQNLMKLLSSLQPNINRPFQNWEDLIEMMSEDDSFKIPLLSPKGFLTLKSTIHNTILNNLIKYSLISITKYDIYGLYDTHNGDINILFPVNFVKSEF